MSPEGGGGLFLGLPRSLTLPAAWKVLKTNYEAGQPIPFRADSSLSPKKMGAARLSPHSRTEVLKVEHAPASPEGLITQALLGPRPEMLISGTEAGPENLHF